MLCTIFVRRGGGKRDALYANASDLHLLAVGITLIHNATRSGSDTMFIWKTLQPSLIAKVVAGIFPAAKTVSAQGASQPLAPTTKVKRDA